MIRPILFNTHMVKQILRGNKTVTRRILKPQPTFDPGRVGLPYALDNGSWAFEIVPGGSIYERAYTPPYMPGDILYIRETFDQLPVDPAGQLSLGHIYFYYKADGDLRPRAWQGNWKPSIHMPKGAARIFLRVTSVHPARLQNITEEDAAKEGCINPFNEKKASLNPLSRFIYFWNGTIPKHPNKFKSYPYYWDDNPWVWVIEFERIEKPKTF